ncbi:hypothetical protein RHDC4_02607 [Rhodocyclaceae bacterium]|nr:hypothetical protein RHDC4_02607 [Rhodocyclaceae bacterium]
MVSGNKGGVGKSLFCLALASALAARGEFFSVLDGDGRAGDVFASFVRKHPARHADFRELRPESHNCPQDAVYEAMVHQLLMTSQHLIINTPDGADLVLMKWFDMTLRHTESNNYQFKFMYLMSDRPDGLEMLADLAQRFLGLYPIRNRHFGNVDRFAAFNMAHEAMFHKVLDFPVLRGDEVRLLFDAHTFPAEAMQERRDGYYRWPVLARARIREWQLEVEDMLQDVLVCQDQSNINLEGV